MDKIKITNHQLFSLTVGCSLGGSILVIAALVTSISKQDAWITVLITAAFSIPVIWAYWFLGNQYPNMTFIGIIKILLGNWLGVIVAFTFIAFCLIIACHLPWYISNFMTTQAMLETPAYVINLLFVIAIVLAVLYGIEVIARACELFIYFTSALFFISMLLVLPNARIENLQPVFEKGIIPILKGSVFLSCFITFPLILLMMIYPINLNSTAETKKPLFLGYIWAAFIIFIGILMSILVLGSTITAGSRFPVYILAKEINVGVVLTRFEFAIDGIWLVTEFIVAILFFYAGVLGLSELLGLRDYRSIVMPIGLIVLVMSGVVLPNAVYQENWVTLVWTPYVITYGLILPILLIIVFLIKKRIFRMDINAYPHP